MPCRPYRLERIQLLPREPDEVFAFFAEAANLDCITPDFLHFGILTPLPIRMRPGACIDYRLRLLGVPFRWRTRIEVFEPPRRFVDVQIQGPYRLWRHEHEFAAVAGGTRVVDRVTYALPFGPLGGLLHALWVQRVLARIFDTRRDCLQARFPAP